MPELSIVRDNYLQVDGQNLIFGDSTNSDITTPGELRDLLSNAKQMIVLALERMYLRMSSLYPDAEVSIGDIWLGQLVIADFESQLTESGNYRYLRAQSNRGVFYDPGNFSNPAVRDYWDAIETNGLVALIRLRSNINNKNISELGLLATINLEDIK